MVVWPGVEAAGTVLTIHNVHDYLRIRGPVATTNEVSSGIFFDLADPRPEQVTIHDIAHHLANICRFNGATGEFYSVAEHSVLCQLYVERHGGGPEEQLAALLHDAAEAYVGDMTSPVKYLIGFPYKWLINRVEDAVARRFGLASGAFHTTTVWEADMVMLQVEAYYLLISAGEGEHWQRPYMPKFDSVERALNRPRCWTNKVALAQFLAQYNSLVRALKQTPGGTIATYAV